MDEELEDCKPCRVAVGIGMYINICRVLDTPETCDDLFEKVTNEKISPEELFHIVKEKARNSPEKLDMLKYIDTLIENANPTNKSYEERIRV